MSQLKYIQIGKQTGDLPFYYFTNENSSETVFRKEGGKLFQQVKQLDLAIAVRQKFNATYGSWFCYKDEENLIYMEALAYKMINEFSDRCKAISGLNSMDDESISFQVKKFGPSICRNFNEPDKINKMAETKQNLEGVKVQMQQNIVNVMTNMDNLDDLEQKSSHMSQQAQLFHKNADQLKRIMYLRNLKLKVIIVVLCLAVLAYIFIPIIKKA